MRYFWISIALVVSATHLATFSATLTFPTVAGIRLDMSVEQAKRSLAAELGPLNWESFSDSSHMYPGTRIFFKHAESAKSTSGAVVLLETDLKGRLVAIRRFESVLGSSPEQDVLRAETAYGPAFERGMLTKSAYGMRFGMSLDGKRLTEADDGSKACNVDGFIENSGVAPSKGCLWAISVSAFPENTSRLQRTIQAWHAQRYAEAYAASAQRAKTGGY